MTVFKPRTVFILFFLLSVWKSIPPPVFLRAVLGPSPAHKNGGSRHRMSRGSHAARYNLCSERVPGAGKSQPVGVPNSLDSPHKYRLHKLYLSLTNGRYTS